MITSASTINLEAAALYGNRSRVAIDFYIATGNPVELDYAYLNARWAARHALAEAPAETPIAVCDGWTEPRHARIVLKDGDPSRVSNGMCPACERAMKAQS